MNRTYKRSFTLIELIMAIVLLSVIAIGLSSVDVFSRVQVFSADRRMQLQQEGSFILAHLSKNAGAAVGNEAVNGAQTVAYTALAGPTTVFNFFIDGDGDGRRTFPDPPPALNTDHWVSYRYWDIFELRYCGLCDNQVCNTCLSGWRTIGTRISNFRITGINPLVNNSVFVTLEERWVPGQAAGSANPSINFQSRIFLPSVSTN